MGAGILYPSFLALLCLTALGVEFRVHRGEVTSSLSDVCKEGHLCTSLYMLRVEASTETRADNSRLDTPPPQPLED